MSRGGRQSDKGTLSGLVQATDGTPLPESVVTASGAQIGERVEVTNEEGRFRFSAVGLHRLGLRPAFFIDPDPAPTPIEQRAYRAAAALGLPVRPALSVEAMVARLRPHRPGLVCYGTPEGEGHITPVLGRRDGDLVLPLAPGGRMATAAFQRRWSEPDILRPFSHLRG